MGAFATVILSPPDPQSALWNGRWRRIPIERDHWQCVPEL